MINILDLKVSNVLDSKEMLAVHGGGYWSFFQPYNTRVAFGDISDGTSNTIQLGESFARRSVPG